MPFLQADEPQISGFNIVTSDGFVLVLLGHKSNLSKLDSRSTVNCAFVSCLASWRMKLMSLPLQA